MKIEMPKYCDVSLTDEEYATILDTFNIIQQMIKPLENNIIKAYKISYDSEVSFDKNDLEKACSFLDSLSSIDKAEI